MPTIRPGNNISKKPGSEDMNVRAAQSAGLNLSTTHIRQMQDIQRQRKIDDERKAEEQRRQEQIKQEQQRREAEEKQEREKQRAKAEFENRVSFEKVTSYDDGNYTVKMSDGSERTMSGDDLKSLLRSDRDFYARYSSNPVDVLDNYNKVIRDIDKIPEQAAEIDAKNAEIENLNSKYENESKDFVKKIEFDPNSGVWNVMNNRGQVSSYESYEDVVSRIENDKAVTQAYLENAYSVDGEFSEDDSKKIGEAVGEFDSWISDVRKSGMETEKKIQDLNEINTNYDRDSKNFVKKIEFDRESGVWNVTDNNENLSSYESYADIVSRIENDKAVTQAYLENAYSVDGELSENDLLKIKDAVGEYDSWISNVRNSGSNTEKEFKKMNEINEMQNSFAQNVEFDNGKWIVTDRSGNTSEYQNYQDVYKRVNDEKIKLVSNLSEYATIDGYITKSEMGTISEITENYNKWLENIDEIGADVQIKWNEFADSKAPSISQDILVSNRQNMSQKIADFVIEYIDNNVIRGSHDSEVAGSRLSTYIKENIDENLKTAGFTRWEDENSYYFTSNYLGGTYSVAKSKDLRVSGKVYYYLRGTTPSLPVYDYKGDPVEFKDGGSYHTIVDGKLYEYRPIEFGQYGTEDDESYILGKLRSADFDVASDYGDWESLKFNNRNYTGMFDKKRKKSGSNPAAMYEHATIRDPTTGETWSSSGTGKTSSVSQLSDQMKWAISNDENKIFADYFKNISISNGQAEAISEAVNSSLASGMTKAQALAIRDSMVSDFKTINASEAKKQITEAFRPTIEMPEQTSAPEMRVFKPSESIPIEDIRSGNIALDQWESIQFVPETANRVTYQDRVNSWYDSFKEVITDDVGISGSDTWQKIIRNDRLKGSFLDPETNKTQSVSTNEKQSTLSVVLTTDTYNALAAGNIKPENLVEYAAGNIQDISGLSKEREHSGQNKKPEKKTEDVFLEGFKNYFDVAQNLPIIGAYAAGISGILSGNLWNEAINTYDGKPTPIEPSLNGSDGDFYDKLLQSGNADFSSFVPDTLAIYDATVRAFQDTVYPTFTNIAGEGVAQDIFRGAILDNAFGSLVVGGALAKTSVVADDAALDVSSLYKKSARNKVLATTVGQFAGGIGAGFRDDPVATAAGFVSLDLLAHGATAGLSKAVNVGKIGTTSIKNVIAYNGLLPDSMLKNNPMVLADSGADWAKSVRTMSDGNLIGYRNPILTDSVATNWKNFASSVVTGNLDDVMKTGYVDLKNLTHRNLIERGDEMIKGGYPGPYPIEAGGTVEYAISKFKINDSVPVLPEFTAAIKELGEDAKVNVSRISDNSLRVRFTPADKTNVKSLAESVDFEFVGDFEDGQPTLKIRRMGSFNDVVEYQTHNKKTKETKTHEITGLTNNVLPDMYSGVGISEIVPVIDYISDIFTTESVMPDGGTISRKTFSQMLYDELYSPDAVSRKNLNAALDETRYHAAGIHATGHRSGQFEYSKPPKNPKSKHAPEPGYFTAPIASPDPSLSPKFLGAVPTDIRFGAADFGDFGLTDFYRGTYDLIRDTPAALKGENALTADIVLAKSVENLPEDVVGNKKAAKRFFYGVGDRSKPDVLYATYKENANINANKMFENEAILVPGAEMERLGNVGFTLVPNTISIYGHRIASYKMPVFLDAYGTTGKFKRTDRARATGIFEDPEKGVVLVEEKNGLLNLIGGGVDPGEKPKAAMLREAREETGIKRRNVSKIKKVKGYEDPEYRRSTSPYLPGEYRNIHTVYEVSVKPGTTFQMLDEVQNIVYWDPRSPIPEQANPATKQILSDFQSRRNRISKKDAVFGTAAALLDNTKTDFEDSFRIIGNEELMKTDIRQMITPRESVLVPAKTERVRPKKRKTVAQSNTIDENTYYVRAAIPKSPVISGYNQHPPNPTTINPVVSNPTTINPVNTPKQKPSKPMYPKPIPPNPTIINLVVPNPTTINPVVPNSTTINPVVPNPTTTNPVVPNPKIHGHADEGGYGSTFRVSVPYYGTPYPKDSYPDIPYPKIPYPDTYPEGGIPEPGGEPGSHYPKPKPVPPSPNPKNDKEKKKKFDDDTRKKKQKRKNKGKRRRENRAKNPVEDIYNAFMSNYNKN